VERPQRNTFRVIVAAAALLLVVGTWSVPLFDPDEARFARTSVEMLRSGDWVVPHFEGAPRLVKPPAVHWIQATLFRLVGPHEWAARLHATAGVLGTLLLVGWIARRRYGEEGAVWAALSLATMPLVVFLGRLGTLDAFLMLHVLAAVALDIAEPEARSRWRGLVVGALLGLAFLIKGPVGVALPLMIMLAGRTAARREVLPSWQPVAQALAGWFLVVLPWGIPFVLRVGEGTAGRTLRTEFLDRIVSGTAHVEPFWYYPPVILVACIPWSVLLVPGLWRVARMWRDPGARTAVYAAAGLIAGVALLSLSRGKLPTYFLPLAPLVALVVAWEIGQELLEPARRVGTSLVTGALVVLAVVLPLAGFRELLPAEVALGGGLVCGAGAIVSAVGVYSRRTRRVFAVAGVTGFLLLLLVVVALPRTVAETRSSFHLIEEVPELRGSRPVVVVEMKLPSLTFYLDRVPELLAAEQLADRIRREDGALYVLDEVDRPLIDPEILLRLREVGRRGKFLVFEVGAATRTPPGEPG